MRLHVECYKGGHRWAPRGSKGGSSLCCIKIVIVRNPCPCGFFPGSKCRCTTGEVNQYLGKISHPLLERIDLCADIPELGFEEMQNRSRTESSERIRERVRAARAAQEERYRGSSLRFNSELGAKQILQYCRLSPEAETLLGEAFRRMQFSMRTYHRILKVARTIADLDQAPEIIREEHVAEAISYRIFDKKYWS